MKEIFPLLVLAFAAASDLPRRPFAPDPPPPPAPPALRAAAETTWIPVHPPGQSPCPPEVAGSPGLDEVWCFEGAGGDSTWPANPPGHWNHWSVYDPPESEASKWHVTTRHGGPSTGTYNAWAGCDSVGTNPDCDTDGWTFQEGYGDDWNYPLVLDCRQEDASAGGSIGFDVRWDCEELYDYLYLEYLDDALGWQPKAHYTGSSGGWWTQPPLLFPAQANGVRFRWRAVSDFVVSDADGRIDTDGIGAIDNLVVSFTASGSVVTDDFETGDFEGIVSSGAFSRWQPLGSAGNPYDGWHLEFMPEYQNQGSDTLFVDDWMWAAKPAGTAILENGFDFFLTSPVIDVSGWSGGIVEYDVYLCAPSKKLDFTTELVRTWDTATGWSLWNDFDGFITFEGCEFWSRNQRESLTPWLGPTVDSLQLAWELLDLSQPGENSWGKHGLVQYLVDNVSVGRIEDTATSAPPPRSLSFALGAAAPNPFRDDTVIRWELPRRTEVTLTIHDVAGRRVRTLVHGMRGPGAGVETWEGRSDDGRRVSAGVYFARMKAADFRATRKIVVLP